VHAVQIDEDAVDSLLSAHLAPTRHLYEIVDKDGDGTLTSKEVRRAARSEETGHSASAHAHFSRERSHTHTHAGHGGKR
jgi:hypothetical protein